jgi:uncharacterized protein YndB with AHSA1/START domain
MSDKSVGTPQSKFVYVTYIKTTADKLWEALTSREFLAQYWLGNQPEADWRAGGSWKIVRPNGELADSGEILEFEPKKRIVIKWQHEMTPDLKAEGSSLCTMEIEPMVNPGGKPGEESMKLTVTHAMERSESKLIAAVGGGWPLILSNLKSVLETGQPLLTKK